MKIKDVKLFWATLVLLIAGTACNSEDPEPVNEEELITTVTIRFTNNGMTDEVVTASFRDLDGPGGNAPVIDDIALNANASYSYEIEFLNEQESPAEDITTEVREEGLDHQVFIIAGGNADISTTYGDQDTNGNPIGLTGTVTTGVAGSGTFDIVLVHEPNKSATGVSAGNISAAGGEEDIRVQFSLSIQ
jgi:hypothetical protein